MIVRNSNLRNIAIIAHVDHGKTTLVDGMFRQSGIFRADQQIDDRIMDSMELEIERGITISAKNCALTWNDTRINIIDTPGHADFGGEVERALSMVDGVVLLVDCSEGPLPQTRFVLRKALTLGLPVIAVINKIDRKDARAEEVLNELYDLFIDLEANDEQLEFPVLYAVGRDGVAMYNIDDKQVDFTPLFESIVKHIPGPSYDEDAPFQMLVTDLDYSDYLGRLAVGRIRNGSVQSKDSLICIGEKDSRSLRATKIQRYHGKQMMDVEFAEPGDIIVIAGLEEVTIGDTICNKENPIALDRVNVDEPTVSMRFSSNSSPLVGREGKIVQARKIRERLDREALSNVSIRVEDTETKESILVKGRGEFQMAIIVETMRREGFELTVGRPEVIMQKDANGGVLEPIEEVHVDCEEIFMGVVTEKLSYRKGRMLNCINHGSGRVRLSFSVPARGLIGYRDEFLTDTRGTGIMNSTSSGYEPYRGDFITRMSGSLISDRAGSAVAYGLYNLEPRGRLFVVPGDPIYEGMVIGEHNRDNDIDVNPAKEKKLSNMRASGKDEHVTLTTVRPMSLESALHFLRDDEVLEVTPLSLRIRKLELNAGKRHQAGGNRKRT